MSHTPYLYPAFYVPTYIQTRIVEKYWVHTGEFYTDHEVVVKPVARVKKGILPSVPSYSRKKPEVRHHDTPISVEDFNTNGTAYNRGRYTTNVNYQSCPQASWLVNGTWFGSVNAEGVDYTDRRMTGTFLSVDGDVWSIPAVEHRSQSISVNTYSKAKAEYCEDWYNQYQYDEATGECLYDDDVVFTREQGEEDEYCYY
jgi:hypothetical protein